MEKVSDRRDWKRIAFSEGLYTAFPPVLFCCIAGFRGEKKKNTPGRDLLESTRLCNAAPEIPAATSDEFHALVQLQGKDGVSLF